ncbi:MAG: hypothetical protein ACRD4I_01540, partial [Candidatus Angelobacter sp.]
MEPRLDCAAASDPRDAPASGALLELAAGAGGGPPLTALIIPERIVSARLGCGGGMEDDMVPALAIATPSPLVAPDPA